MNAVDADPTDCSSTLSNSDLMVDAKFNAYDSEVSDSDEDDIGITLKADKSNNLGSKRDGKSKQSTPNQTNPRSLENIFGRDENCKARSDSRPGLQALSRTLQSEHSDRSIITRNSSVLESMRKARSMLTSDNGSAKSKADAIDILANAMTKANVEAKTGQRILESVASKNKENRAAVTPLRKDYQDMPKVSKVLERLASTKGSKKVNLSSVKTPLKRLVEKAAEQKDFPPQNTGLSFEKKDTIDKEPVSKAAVLPALMAGPAGLRAATGLLGNILQQDTSSAGHSTLLSTVFSSNITAVGSEPSKSRPVFTRSLSSGDIKSLDKENITNIGPLDTDLESDSASRGRRNSIATDMSVSNITKGVFTGLALKRSNNSGSLSDLAKQMEAKATTDSPPKVTPFISFDNYGVEDYSFGYGSGSSSSTSKSITTTSVSNAETATTTTVATASKPTGFLRGLFLSSSSGGTAAEGKRPSSVHEDSSPSLNNLGKGSASSVESGMNRFGKALVQDDFGGFGFGFMSYFSGSKKS